MPPKITPRTTPTVSTTGTPLLVSASRSLQPEDSHERKYSIEVSEPARRLSFSDMSSAAPSNVSTSSGDSPTDAERKPRGVKASIKRAVGRVMDSPKVARAREARNEVLQGIHEAREMYGRYGRNETLHRQKVWRKSIDNVKQVLGLLLERSDPNERRELDRKAALAMNSAASPRRAKTKQSHALVEHQNRLAASGQKADPMGSGAILALTLLVKVLPHYADKEDEFYFDTALPLVADAGLDELMHERDFKWAELEGIKRQVDELHDRCKDPSANITRHLEVLKDVVDAHWDKPDNPRQFLFAPAPRDEPGGVLFLSPHRPRKDVAEAEADYDAPLPRAPRTPFEDAVEQVRSSAARSPAQAATATTFGVAHAVIRAAAVYSDGDDTAELLNILSPVRLKRSALPEKTRAEFAQALATLRLQLPSSSSDFESDDALQAGVNDESPRPLARFDDSDSLDGELAAPPQFRRPVVDKLHTPGDFKADPRVQAFGTPPGAPAPVKPAGADDKREEARIAAELNAKLSEASRRSPRSPS